MKLLRPKNGSNKNFCDLGAHAKFRNPMTTPSGGIGMREEEEVERKNT